MLSFILYAVLLFPSCVTDASNDAKSEQAANDPFFGRGAKSRKMKHELSKLKIFEKDLQLVKTQYVDSHRLTDKTVDKMFIGVLEKVEKNVDEVRFVFSTSDRKLYATVGRRTKMFLIEPLETVDDLTSNMLPIARFLDQALSSKVKRDTVEYLFINGALSALDPHTLLLPPVEAMEMEVDNQGEFGGLGIEIIIKNGMLTVKQPIEGTPAFRAGLKADDKIVRIEGTSTINMDLNEAVALLRGKVGTKVTIMVHRKGWNKPKPYPIIRGKIKINPVKVEVLPKNIAYINIQAFNANVSKDMNAFLDSFGKRRSLRGIILDLRYNPGGYLRQAQLVSDKFIDKGVVVSTVEGSERRRDSYNASSSGTVKDVPIVVLVNGSSASASEIVAGALRNLNRAIIVGERTFGKGSVQHLYSNPDDSRLKLTEAQYLTPGDRSIQSVGIPPDILLQPSYVQKSKQDGADPLISLYWREWIEREADLDHHLNYDVTLDDDITYQLRYLNVSNDSQSNNPRKDWEVQFAHKILKNTASANRVSMLRSAKTLVEDVRAEQQQKIIAAFQTLGLDWSPGENPTNPKLSIKAHFGKVGQVIHAGRESYLHLEVTNNEPVDLHQISAYTESENPSLHHREFYFGKIKAGERKTIKKKVVLPYGYGEAIGDLVFHFRDPSTELYEHQSKYHSKANKRPRFEYSIRMFDDGSGNSVGDGDGIPEQGELIELEVEVKNIGEGTAVEPYLRLKNKSRKYLDLISGTVEPGKNLTLDGKTCEKNTEGCYRLLKPGETHKERLKMELRKLPKKSWHLELLAGDNKAYDYDTIVTGEFRDFFKLKQDLYLYPNKKFEPWFRSQPNIAITKDVPVKIEGDFCSFSGVAEDDNGIREVIIFKNKEKVFYRGESGVTPKLPFTIEEDVQNGENRFYILTRDTSGLTTTQSINVRRDDSPGVKNGHSQQD